MSDLRSGEGDESRRGGGDELRGGRGDESRRGGGDELRGGRGDESRGDGGDEPRRSQAQARASENGNGAGRGFGGAGERTDESLLRLAKMLRDRGGMIATLLVENGHEQPAASDAGPPPSPGPAQLAAAGPRASADPDEYELLIEAIYEGYLLHYASPRLLRAPEEDLALLAGDQLYALGLARLVSLGDVAAVAELADVITLCALAHGASRPELAQAVWRAGARAIGWGASPAHRRAKELARAGSGEALAAMQAAAEPTP